MTVKSYDLELGCQGFCDIQDLTPGVASRLTDSGVRDGLLTVFVPGSTAAVTTIEFESGALADLRRALEELAPQHRDYAHNARWNDGNGFAHVRAALLGPSLTVPVRGGELQLGTWQQIVLLDFDNRPRQRTVLVQVLGE